MQMGAYTLTTWGISFFERVHGLSEPKAAVSLSLTGGVATLVGCLLAGPIIGALRRRGMQDAPLKLCIVASVAHTIFAVLGLLAPTTGLALAAFPLASFWSYVPAIAALSVLGYEHDLSQPVVRLWNDVSHVIA